MNKSVKKNIDLDEVRRKREDKITQLRKNIREEAFTKRRSFLDEKSTLSSLNNNGYTSNSRVKFEKPGELTTSMCSLKHQIYSEDPQQQYLAMNGFRKLLCIDNEPPIEEVIQLDVIPRFVEFLRMHENPGLQFESAWALTNIASGSSDHTYAVIESGAVPIFCQLLQSTVATVKEQAVWALGNIAGDSSACRDLVLSSGALMPLLSMINDSCTKSLLRNCTWTLSNLCRHNPKPRFETVYAALPVLAALLHSEDVEVLTDACWALSYLSDGPNCKIQAVIDTGISRKLIELLASPDPTVLVPALRTVGNIVTGSDAQTDVIINAGVLPCLNSFLVNGVKKSLRKEACWTISNITAGTLQQIRAVIEANIIPPLVHILATAEFDIKKEAAWAISNAASGGSPIEIKFLASCGSIPPLCELLVCQDNRIIILALDGLDKILKAGNVECTNEDVRMKLCEREDSVSSKVNPYALMIDECGGLEKIEALLRHSLDDIYDKALKIIENHFASSDSDDVDTAPQINHLGGFSFGPP